jgi:hypothetical protein
LGRANPTINPAIRPRGRSNLCERRGLALFRKAPEAYGLSAATYGDWRLPFDRYGHLGEAAQTYWADGVLAAGIFKTP